MSKYEHLSDGDTILLDTKTTVLKLCCCDCFLVHELPINVVRKNGKLTNKIKIKVYRDNKATATIRRANKTNRKKK